MMKHDALVAKIGVAIAEKEPQEELEKRSILEGGSRLYFLSVTAALPFDDIGIFEYIRHQS